MHLAERDSQLKVLRELLDESSQRSARIAVVSGATATGKTALLSALAEQAASSGALFAAASASPAGRALPLSVLDQLLRNAELPAEFAERASGLLNAATLAASLHGPELARGERHRSLLSGVWVNSLWGLLRDLAARRPVVVAIDNAHHADEDSLLCLSYLMRRLRSARLLVVLTVDVSCRQEHPLMEAEFLIDPHVRHIAVETLSASGVREMLAQHLDLGTAELLKPDACRASGGNPLLVTALLSDCRLYSKTPTKLVTGDAFQAAVASCLHRSEPTVREVAHALAVAGHKFPVHLLDELLGLSRATTGLAQEALALMGFVAGGHLSHEAIQAATLNAMTPAARTEMHRRVARLLYEHGMASADVAPHVAATDQAESGWMQQVLQEAAAEALSGCNVETAIRYLRLARKSCHAQPQQAVILSMLASAEWRVSPATAARHLTDLSAAVRAGHLRGQHADSVIMYLLWCGHGAEARALLAARRWEYAATGPLQGGTPIDHDSLRSWAAFLYPDAAETTAASRSVNSHTCDTATTCRTEQQALCETFLRGQQGDYQQDAQRILERASVDETTMPKIIIALATLVYLDQHEKAALYCEKLMEEDSIRSIPARQAMFSALYSAISLGLGNPAQGKRYGNLALSLVSPPGWGVAIGLPLGSALLAATVMSHFKEAADLLRIPVPAAMFQTPVALCYLHARGRYYLATKNFDAALDDFQLCGSLMNRWGLDAPSLVPWRTRAAEACLGLGQDQQAKKLLSQELGSLGSGHHRTRGICLRVSAGLSDPGDRPDVLREAIELLNRSGDRTELALTFADLSQAHEALGESRQARILSQLARRLASQCGIALTQSLVPGAGAEPELCGGTSLDHPLAKLSDAEFRVAALAAHGYTNREIAEKLFITISTVEQHLTHVYRKLSVSRRIDLPLGMSPSPELVVVPAESRG